MLPALARSGASADAGCIPTSQHNVFLSDAGRMHKNCRILYCLSKWLGVGPSTNRMTEDDWQQSVQESTQNQSTANWHASGVKTEDLLCAVVCN